MASKEGMRRVPSFSGRPGFPRGLKVLLLEGRQPVRTSVEAQLKECAYEVTAAGNVNDACTLLGQSTFDIILAEAEDLRRKKSDTVEFMCAMKNTPLIMMSESESPGDVLQGIKLGAVDFLKRPLAQLKLQNIWQHTVRKMMGDVAVGNPAQASASGSGSGGVRTGDLSSSMPQSTSQSTGKALQRPSEQVSAAKQVTNAESQGRSEASEQSCRRSRKTSRDSNGSSTTAQTAPLTAKPPTVTSNPLMGIPPGCVPPIGNNGMAIGMPMLNQPPFAPPNPLNVNPFSIMPVLPPQGLGPSAPMPGAMTFPTYPLIPPGLGGFVPQALSGLAGAGMGGDLGGGAGVGNSGMEVDVPDAARGGSTSDSMLVDSSDQAPLGLNLRKSPSLINMISKNLANMEVPV